MIGIMNKETKIYYLEALRAVAALSVVALHLSAVNWFGYIGSFNWIVFTVIQGTMRFCVPAFFMISGALFLRKDKELSVEKVYTKYVPRMVIFLVFWGMVYQIYNQLSAGGENIIWNAVKNILKGDTQVHLWFVYAITGIYLFVPIIKIFTNNAGKKLLQYAILLVFFITGIIPVFRLFSWKCFQIITINFDKMNIGSIGSYVGYFLLGHYIHTYEITKKSRYVMYGLGGAGAVFTVIMTLYACITTNTIIETYFAYTMPNVILWSTAIFILFKYNFANEGRLSAWIRRISNASLGIYGIHLLIIFIISDLGISTLSFNALLSVPLLFAAVGGISIAVVSGLKKIPYLGKYIF